MRNFLRKIEDILERNEWKVLLLIIIFAFFLRVENLSKSGWQDDEIAHLLPSVSLITGRNYGNIHYSNGLLGKYLSLPAVLLTNNIQNALLVSKLIRIFFGIGTIYLIFLLVKEFWNSKTALLASFLTAVISSYIYISLVALSEALVDFLLVLSIYSIFRFNSTKNEKFIYLFLVTSGLAVSAHLSAGLFLMAILPLAFIFFKPNLRKELDKKTIFVSVIIIFGIIILNWNVISILASPQSWGLAKDVNLLNVHGNLSRGVFIKLPVFLKGVNKLPLTGLDYFKAVLIFGLTLPCLKTDDKKDKFLLFSFLVCIALVSTLTISDFRAIMFHILLPFISILIARGFKISYKKIGILALVTLVSFLCLDITATALFMKKIPTSSIDRVYYHCEERLVNELTTLSPNKVFMNVVNPFLPTIKYKSYKMGEYFKLYTPKENRSPIEIKPARKALFVEVTPIERWMAINSSPSYLAEPVQTIKCNVSYPKYVEIMGGESDIRLTYSFYWIENWESKDH